MTKKTQKTSKAGSAKKTSGKAASAKKGSAKKAAAPKAAAPANEAASPVSDPIAMMIARARALAPAALDAFLSATPKKELHAVVERVTGQKTSGRLSPESAIARIKEALAVAPAAAQSEPAAIAATDDPSAAPSDDETHAAATTATTGASAPAGAPSAKRARPAREPKPEVEAREPKERDARLPEVGTVLRKVDRHGNERVRCTVEADGIRYGGTLYKSLSGAAMAAAKDLGLESKTQDGFAFWQLKKVASPASKKNPLEALDRAFARYQERAGAVLKAASDDDRGKVQAAINQQIAALTSLASPVA